MTGAHAITHTALVLGGVSAQRLVRVERLALQVPALTEGALLSASVGFQARLGDLSVELALGEDPATLARIRQRLAFWLAREGGSARPVEGMGADELLRFRNALRISELCALELSTEKWSTAVRRIFAAAGAEGPGDVPEEAELRLHLDGTGWQGLTFDAASRRLEIPSPLAPPAGDVLRLVLEGAACAGPCVVRGRVVAVRSPAHASVGAPAGFVVALSDGSDDAAHHLAARCPPRPRGTTRTAPRYQVAGGAQLADPGEELRYGSDDEFQPDHPRARRVLIVDDDALVRQILVEAFEARGFETRTAADGEAGLRAITDELLALDAVVTDVQMPGLSGEALVSSVRSAGGEGELAVVVVGATLGDELTARLEAAGADRILSKAAGASSVVDAVEEVLRVRATLIPSAANEGDPFGDAAEHTLAAAR